MSSFRLTENTQKDSAGSVLATESLATQTRVDLSSFEAFCNTFPLRSELLYSTVFERNANIVQTQKAKFAVANLEKIFSATFSESSASGFDRMSLRDLSRRTGMSMGAIYSCIGKKEDIAVMIADVVRLSSELTQQHILNAPTVWTQVEQSIRFHLYASTLLQPWYFFLFFETRSLPDQQQNESKQIELDGINIFQSYIEQGVKTGEFNTKNAHMVANTIVVLLEDWYLKPWKTQTLGFEKSDSKNLSFKNMSASEREQSINQYHQSIIELVKTLLTD